MNFCRRLLLRPLRVCAALLLASATAGVAAQPVGFAINSRGNLDDSQVDVLWALDLSTGTARALGKVGNFIDVEGLALAPDGTLYGADDGSKTVLSINPNSGFPTALGGAESNMGMPIGTPLDVGLSMTCRGELLMVSDVDRSLFRVDRESGRVTRIGESGSLGVPMTDIAVLGEQAYGIGEGVDGAFRTASPSLFRIDMERATAEEIGPLGDRVAPYANAGLSFDASGRLWAVTDRRDSGAIDLPSQIIEIDPRSGAAISVRDADLVGFESLALAPPLCGAMVPGEGDVEEDEPPAIPATGPISLLVMALLLLLFGRSTLLRTQR